jgi:RNA polymerase subunit RPABC4/transcription elongation factor Spt4
MWKVGPMITKLVDAVFGCRHSRFSVPVTIRRAARRPQAAALTGTYVACLECGKEFPYDWQAMKVITSPEKHRQHLTELAKHAA